MNMKYTKKEINSKQDINITCVSYADKNFRRSQIFQYIALLVLGFKNVKLCGIETIPLEFKNKNSEIFLNKKGGGLWLWKPWVIYIHMQLIKEGDWIFYIGSGAFPIASIEGFKSLIRSQTEQIICFELPVIEKQFTHEYCVSKVAKSLQYAESNMIHASYMLIQNTKNTQNIIYEWLTNCQNPRILGEMDSEISNFQGHRHDQSIWSLLIKNYQIQPLNDISQLAPNPALYSVDQIL